MAEAIVLILKPEQRATAQPELIGELKQWCWGLFDNKMQVTLKT